jgi:propanol-preferring alcohol dehydrogenase
MSFSAKHGVAAMTEVLPFKEAPKAYDRMMSGKARFRVVLEMQDQL